jgi:branched-chain amino acid transport system ATP-binding protein
MLKIQGLNVFYGGIHAVRGIDIEVPDGQIITLIGANGAGKSTTLNSIMGIVKTASGTIDWTDSAGTVHNLVGRDAKDIVPLGLIMVPEGRRIFPNLTVEENLRLGAYCRKDTAAIHEQREKCFELFPRLKERRKQSGGTLSGGEQQMLAVARGLMGSPKLLMLDEPSLGLAPIICEDIFRIVHEINEEGVTVLLIEQNARAALEIADYAYVLETGVVSMHDKGSVLLNDDRIRKAYLGNA